MLLNKNENKKSKFIVELEERGESGKSRVRIDIWKVDEETAPKIDETINRLSHAQTSQSSTPKGQIIQRERQYPSPHLTFREDMPSVNQSIDNQSLQDYGPRMVPEVHNVFTDTRLIYRVIILENAVGELYDIQEDHEASVAELYNRVTHLEAIAVEQREIIEELVDPMDQHTTEHLPSRGATNSTVPPTVKDAKIRS